MVVRFLVEDDPRQSARARAVVIKAIADNTHLFLSDIVVCEVVWVLESAYSFARAEIAAVLNRLLNARHLTFRSKDQLLDALDAYGAGKGDFADYLIRADALDAGCEEVVTFDKMLHREKHFRAP